jgi:cephalosporin hydroxylase
MHKQEIIDNYNHHCNDASDINEHLPTLRKYASQCDSVLELGVRRCISTWAFAYGLLENGLEKKDLMVNDIDVDDVSSCCNEVGIKFESQWISDLELNISERNFDMVFIDTWHVYPQLKRELKIFSKITNKYIVMHDTEVDGIHGESVSVESDIKQQSIDSGFSEIDISYGLEKAIIEFLTENKDWTMKEKFYNNNGLTILCKI